MTDTFADYLSRGTTKGTAFVLVIEGAKYILATDPRCEQTLADGRTIVSGLSTDNLGIEESVYIPGADLDLTLNTVTITETTSIANRDAVTRLFTSYVGQTTLTYLRSAVTLFQTAIDVGDTSAVTVGDFVHMGTETWKVTAVLDEQTIEVDREQWGTQQQAYEVSTATTAGVDLDILPLYAEPGCYAGRRCWLYGRGLDELTTASATAGTLLWRGMVSADPELDTATWSLSLSSRMSLLDGKIGREADAETKLRGIYYPTEGAFSISIDHHSGASAGSSTGSTTVYFDGFYETQADFCEALQLVLEAARVAQGWTGSFAVRETATTGWELYYTPGAVPAWINVTGGSPADGWFTAYLSASEDPSLFIPVTTVAASTIYRCVWDGSGTSVESVIPASDARRVPRACYTSRVGARTPTLTYPIGRFYLDRSAGYAASASLFITPPTREGEDEADPVEVPVANFSVEGYVQAAATFEVPPFTAAGETQPTISLSIRYGSSLGCNLAEFVAAVIAESPLSCNQGITPWVTGDDFADWTDAVVAAAAGKPWLTHRDYVFAKPVKFGDVLKQECRIYGLFMYLDSDGKIAVRSNVMSTTTPSVTIDDASHMPDGESFGTLDITPDGIINEITVKSGYDPHEGKHTGREYDFKLRGASMQAKGKTVPLEIAPLVNPHTGGDVALEEIAGQVYSILYLYGARRYIYEIPVTMLRHSLRLGDSALLTIPQLPYGGARGSTTSGAGLFQHAGTVVGRRWMYGEEPRGFVKFLVHGLNIAGYAPTCRVASASGSARTWVLTCTASHYGPGGAVTDASFFATGYKVRLRQWDKTQPQVITGTVTARSGNDISVTLDADWMGVGSSTWTLGFGKADSGITAGQKLYVYIAPDTYRISYDSGGRVAHNFG